MLTVGHDELSGTRGRVKVRFPAERPRATPGFSTVTGLRGPALPTRPPASCYLNLRADAAASVFTDLVRYLDSLGLRFTARLLADPAWYGRPDAAVVTASRSAIPWSSGWRWACTPGCATASGTSCRRSPGRWPRASRWRTTRRAATSAGPAAG